MAQSSDYLLNLPCTSPPGFHLQRPLPGLDDHLQGRCAVHILLLGHLRPLRGVAKARERRPKGLPEEPLC